MSANADAPPITATVTVPAGTKLLLRFAQPVYGRVVAPKNVAVEEGTTVRLVAATDLRTHGRTVIAKGAIAQATVKRVLTAQLRWTRA